jgi:hypothetical protein
MENRKGKILKDWKGKDIKNYEISKYRIKI